MSSTWNAHAVLAGASHPSRLILGIDPSGNFAEGKGTTGFALYDPEADKVLCTDAVGSEEDECAEAYWRRVILYIETIYLRFKGELILSMESYILYDHKGTQQTWSSMETPQLIGAIRYFAFDHQIILYMRPAVQVKKRWSNEILEHKQYIEKRSNSHTLPGCNHKLATHELDAIRHALHCAKFEVNE